jgi:hypothetical protein
MERRQDALLTFTCEADRSWREGPRRVRGW